MDDTVKPQDESVVDESSEVTEGEVVNADASQAIVLSNLENLIRSHIANIERLQLESKKQKEMIDNVFENDATFRDHTDKAKEAMKVKSTTRAEIMKQPAVVSIVNKLKEMKAEQKEMQDELSEYLLEYQRLSGATTIEDDKGEVREIVNSAKAVKRS